MRPNVKASANGMRRIEYSPRKSLNLVGFSNGWAEFALKNPPPFVATILIASWLATGPPGILCVAPATVCTGVKPEDALDEDDHIEEQDADDAEREERQRVDVPALLTLGIYPAEPVDEVLDRAEHAVEP